MINIRAIKSEARILLIDIETGKMTFEGDGYQRKLYSQFLPSDWIKTPVWIVCVGWKWLGSNTIGSASVLHDPERFAKDYRDDYAVVKVMHALLSEADIVVGHNVDKFDIRQINKRCIFHGFDPIKPYLTVDTLKLARQVADFEANDLKYLARFLGLDEKDEAPDWGLISKGDEEEIKKCVKYNRKDVRVLEGVYLKLRGWAKNRPNRGLYQKGVEHNICPVCESADISQDNPFYTSTRKYEGYRCNSCRAYIKSKVFVKTTEIK